MLRPNPTADWKPFNDEVYDPIWQAACDTELAVGLHPFLDATCPARAVGLRINRLGNADVPASATRAPIDIDNMLLHAGHRRTRST